MDGAADEFLCTSVILIHRVKILASRDREAGTRGVLRISPSVIVDGYDAASQQALKLLQNISVRVDIEDTELKR